MNYSKIEPLIIEKVFVKAKLARQSGPETDHKIKKHLNQAQ